MPPAFLTLLKKEFTTTSKSHTNFRKPLEVGLKLAVTLRHLSTGESYTSLEYHWGIGRTTICKFVPKVCKAIFEEFQQEYLICPTDPKEWRGIGEKFRSDGMSPVLLMHWMVNIFSPRSQAVNISTTKVTSPWYC